jgi:cytochrome c oxidase subunit 4
MNVEGPSARSLLLTWVALVALAAASFGLSHASVGRVGVALALGIALAKAALVATVFMELAHQRFTNRLVLVTAVALIVLLGALMVADVLTRQPG